MATAKPKTIAGYGPDHTLLCERALVTLLRGFGTLKHTLRLVGGLVPRYLTPERPPEVPAHAGTMDVDIVLNIQVLTQGDLYKTLAQQLKERGFARAVNAQNHPSSWRWERKVDEHRSVLVEFLRDEQEEMPAGGVFTVDGERVSALAIRHAGIVHDWFNEREVTAELLDDAGVATETVRFADTVSFIVLKALAFDDRHENKDAADLLHVMRYAGEPDWIASQFRERLAKGKHADAIHEALATMEKRFCGNAQVEGFRRDGPLACGVFMHGSGPGAEEARILEQRYASALVTQILELIRS